MCWERGVCFFSLEAFWLFLFDCFFFSIWKDVSVLWICLIFISVHIKHSMNLAYKPGLHRKVSTLVSIVVPDAKSKMQKSCVSKLLMLTHLQVQPQQALRNRMKKDSEVKVKCLWTCNIQTGRTPNTTGTPTKPEKQREHEALHSCTTTSSLPDLRVRNQQNHSWKCYEHLCSQMHLNALEHSCLICRCGSNVQKTAFPFECVWPTLWHCRRDDHRANNVDWSELGRRSRVQSSHST